MLDCNVPRGTPLAGLKKMIGQDGTADHDTPSAGSVVASTPGGRKAAESAGFNRSSCRRRRRSGPGSDRHLEAQEEPHDQGHIHRGHQRARVPPARRPPLAYGPDASLDLARGCRQLLCRMPGWLRAGPVSSWWIRCCREGK